MSLTKLSSLHPELWTQLRCVQWLCGTCLCCDRPFPKTFWILPISCWIWHPPRFAYDPFNYPNVAECQKRKEVFEIYVSIVIVVRVGMSLLNLNSNCEYMQVGRPCFSAFGSCKIDAATFLLPVELSFSLALDHFVKMNSSGSSHPWIYSLFVFAFCASLAPSASLPFSIPLYLYFSIFFSVFSFSLSPSLSLSVSPSLRACSFNVRPPHPVLATLLILDILTLYARASFSFAFSRVGVTTNWGEALGVSSAVRLLPPTATGVDGTEAGTCFGSAVDPLIGVIGFGGFGGCSIPAAGGTFGSEAFTVAGGGAGGTNFGTGTGAGLTTGCEESGCTLQGSERFRSQV